MKLILNSASTSHSYQPVTTETSGTSWKKSDYFFNERSSRSGMDPGRVPAKFCVPSRDAFLNLRPRPASSRQLSVPSRPVPGRNGTGRDYRDASRPAASRNRKFSFFSNFSLIFFWQFFLSNFLGFLL